MDTKIPQETKDRWLPLLEDGLTQARRALYDDGVNGYCCLGVYAKACGATFYRETIEVEGSEDEPRESDVKVDLLGQDINAQELLEQSWASSHGISPEAQELLSNLNDGGEHTVRRDNLLIHVWLKHAVDVVELQENRLRLTLPTYDFAQIAEVIREDL